MTNEARSQYDVAFSFASEQRLYVEETVRKLEQLDIRVFYDANQQVDLWGTDLYQYLSDVYCNQARFCVVFLSQAYRNKLWTRHELKSIQARAFQESREYLLPVRFDDVEIPGLLPTIAYLDGNSTSASELATLISKKVGGSFSSKGSGDDSRRDFLANKTEAQLAEAVFDAEDYLRPQPLRKADNVAENIRCVFRSLDIEPTRKHLAPYLIDHRAAFRVVGYIAWQIYRPSDTVLDLVSCVNAEQIEAMATTETRPLWQLLVCFTYLLGEEPQSERSELIRNRLKHLSLFLSNHDSIDPGGECQERISNLTA